MAALLYTFWLAAFMSLLNAVSDPLFAVDHQFATVPKNWFSEAIAIDSRIYEQCFKTAIPSFILFFRIFFPADVSCKLVFYARDFRHDFARKSNRAWLTNGTYLSGPRILREDSRLSLFPLHLMQLHSSVGNAASRRAYACDFLSSARSMHKA